MKLLNKLTSLILMVFVMSSFSQCASTLKLQEDVPLEIGEVYYQHWVAGVKGGGSGVNLFIPIESNQNNIVLDSVYFKGKQEKLELKNNTIYIGRFASKANQKQDIIMSSDPQKEYGNPIPELSRKTPFKLHDNECVVSYFEKDKIKYFKIMGIVRKESKLYQKAPSKKL